VRSGLGQGLSLRLRRQHVRCTQDSCRPVAWLNSAALARAVEKVRSVLLTRNNRINGVDFLNRTYAFDAHFESMLLRGPPKIFFHSIGQLRTEPQFYEYRIPSIAALSSLPVEVESNRSLGALASCCHGDRLPN